MERVDFTIEGDPIVRVIPYGQTQQICPSDSVQKKENQEEVGEAARLELESGYRI